MSFENRNIIPLIWVIMTLLKYKKEYKRFRNNALKTYFILDNLMYDISKDKTLEKKQAKNILGCLNSTKRKYTRIITDIETFDFNNIKEKVKKKKCINNLVVLPLYKDENIYVDSNIDIGDIFHK